MNRIVVDDLPNRVERVSRTIAGRNKKPLKARIQPMNVKDSRKGVRTFVRDQKGFTLIEMAIVLVIIGIIIGAVIKGKDLVRGGEQKRLYSNFFNAWYIVYNNYYDRTGLILGDSNTSDNNGDRDGRCSNPSPSNLISQIKRVGLEPPTSGPTGDATTRTYTDSNGRNEKIDITFQYTEQHGNIIRVDRIPNEIGIAWDKLIDEQVDGKNGSFRYIPTTSAMGITNDWPSAEDEPRQSSAAIWKLPF
jgi:prepilin-type N-terminal cleavage/methylation domain-containing protein